ncbi:hypothetical protein L9G15_25805, partial [Shewanella sp. A3A]|nr:hypothetical protein [Shewanella ferrihydritica]
MLDALNATLEKQAVKNRQSYSIEGRSLESLDAAELLRWQMYFARIVEAEDRALRRSQGMDTRAQV